MVRKKEAELDKKLAALPVSSEDKSETTRANVKLSPTQIKHLVESDPRIRQQFSQAFTKKEGHLRAPYRYLMDECTEDGTRRFSLER